MFFPILFAHKTIPLHLFHQLLLELYLTNRSTNYFNKPDKCVKLIPRAYKSYTSDCVALWKTWSNLNLKLLCLLLRGPWSSSFMALVLIWIVLCSWSIKILSCAKYWVGLVLTQTLTLFLFIRKFYCPNILPKGETATVGIPSVKLYFKDGWKGKAH